MSRPTIGRVHLQPAVIAEEIDERVAEIAGHLNGGLDADSIRRGVSFATTYFLESYHLVQIFFHFEASQTDAVWGPVPSGLGLVNSLVPIRAHAVGLYTTEVQSTVDIRQVPPGGGAGTSIFGTPFSLNQKRIVPASNLASTQGSYAAVSNFSVTTLTSQYMLKATLSVATGRRTTVSLTCKIQHKT